jgi:hypothetical protein
VNNADFLLNMLDTSPILLDVPNFTTPMLVGNMHFTQLHLLSIEEKPDEERFLFGYGAAINSTLDFILTKEDAFSMLAHAIKIGKKKVKFHALVVPIGSGIVASAERNKNIFMRILKYYEVRIDQIITRYDIMIEKVQ